MQCIKPVKITRKTINEHTFGEGHDLTEFGAPCRKCRACRANRLREWVVRMLHEAKEHPADQCWFVTLTYASEHLPYNEGLHHDDVQKFLKKLRNRGFKFRYYCAGEYGKAQEQEDRDTGEIIPKKINPFTGEFQLGRPHYHIAIFGLEIDDYIESHDHGESQLIEDTWSKGWTSIDPLNVERMSYLCKYISKQMFGDPQESHYQRISEKTGEVNPVKREYAAMSRNPGIGAAFMHKYQEDIAKGFVTDGNGKKMPIPAFYLKQLKNMVGHSWDELEKEALAEKITADRYRNAKKLAEQTPQISDELAEYREKHAQREYEERIKQQGRL